MNEKRLEKPEPYCPELLPSNKRCNGTIYVIDKRVDVELYHEQAVGQPPFIEVPCKSWRRLFSGEVLWYYHDTDNLVGFASPTLEFLDREVSSPLLENLSLITTSDAAEKLECSPRYLEKLRNLGQGPKFWRLAEYQHVFEVWYDRKDVEAYAAERKSRPERRGGCRKRKGDQKVQGTARAEAYTFCSGFWLPVAKPPPGKRALRLSRT